MYSICEGVWFVKGKMGVVCYEFCAEAILCWRYVNYLSIEKDLRCGVFTMG